MLFRTVGVRLLLKIGLIFERKKSVSVYLIAKLINKMKKIPFLFFLFLLLAHISLPGQSRREALPLKDRLWYGAGFTGNFSGSAYTSNVVVGLAPMVGYKITDNFSVGPRVSALVSFYKQQWTPTQTERVTPADWSVGLFARYRIARAFFAHLEYDYQDEAYIFTDASGLRIRREGNNAIYAGGGYSTPLGQHLGLEISLNYYLNQPFDDFRNPLNYRFGINYRF